MTSFSAPAQSLIAAGQTLQEMRTEMERVEDVMEYPMDEEAPKAIHRIPMTSCREGWR